MWPDWSLGRRRRRPLWTTAAAIVSTNPSLSAALFRHKFNPNVHTVAHGEIAAFASTRVLYSTSVLQTHCRVERLSRTTGLSQRLPTSRHDGSSFTSRQMWPKNSSMRGGGGRILVWSVVEDVFDEVDVGVEGTDHDSDRCEASVKPSMKASLKQGSSPDGEAADGINKNGGRRSDNNGGDPDVRSLVDLVNMLHTSENPLWDLVRFEGREASKQSHISVIHDSVLARASLENAVSSDVAHKMDTTFLSATELNALVSDMFEEEPGLGLVVADDLLAHVMRDSALPDLLTVLLFHKGFTALTTYRLMHWLWRKDRSLLARYLQSVCSEVCAADIHPASRIGKGVFMAGGCDVVIGETAVVGDDVCLLQGVTLGGTGNQTGDRHPKVAKGCHIGAGSSILGNIVIGEGSRIEAASVVVKPVVPYSVNRGVPSKRVAFVVCDPFQEMGGRGVFNNNNNNNSDRNENSDSDNSGKGKQGKSGSHGVRRRMFSNYVSPYMGV